MKNKVLIVVFLIFILGGGTVWLLKNGRSISIDHVGQLEEVSRVFYSKNGKLPDGLSDVTRFAKSHNFPFEDLHYKNISYSHEDGAVAILYVDNNGGSGRLIFRLETKDPVADLLEGDSEVNLFELVNSLRNILFLYKKDKGNFPKNIQDINAYIQEESIEFDTSIYQSIQIKKRIFGGAEVTCDLGYTNEYRNLITFDVP